MAVIDWAGLVIVPVLTVAVSEVRYWARPTLAALLGKLGVRPTAEGPGSTTPQTGGDLGG